MSPQKSISDADIRQLLNDVNHIYGYDFSGYEPVSIKRRLEALIRFEELDGIEALHSKLVKNKNYIRAFISEITVGVTEMFRDASFFQSIRTHIIPVLASMNEVNICHVGCAGGEEVYSMCILLDEAGILSKVKLVATDIDEHALDLMKRGQLLRNRMPLYTRNYEKAGGQYKLTKYFELKGESAFFNRELMQHVVVMSNNIVSDPLPSGNHFLLCRNLLIYFTKTLRQLALHKIDNSIISGGFLALGSRETIKLTGIDQQYRQLGVEKIWQKKGSGLGRFSL
jgi:chemotaxis protein methyltransferase CheR